MSEALSGTPIRIIVGDRSYHGVLGTGTTAVAIRELLPIEGSLHRFDGELSVEIPLEVDPEPDATNEVEVGTIAYWAPGRALSFFFGSTPLTAAGADATVIASSAVTVIGRFEMGGDEEPGIAEDATSIRVEGRS